MPPCRTIRRTTVSPLFQAPITGFGRPGPGTRALGLTEPPVVGGAVEEVPAPGVTALVEPAEGVAPATGAPVAGGVVAADEAVESELEEPPPFMFIMKKSPTITASPPSTATWTMGLL